MQQTTSVNKLGNYKVRNVSRLVQHSSGEFAVPSSPAMKRKKNTGSKSIRMTSTVVSLVSLSYILPRRLIEKARSIDNN